MQDGVIKIDFTFFKMEINPLNSELSPTVICGHY